MYLKILSALLLSLTITGCSFLEEKPEVPDKYQPIIKQDRPRGLELEPVEFRAVTSETLNEVTDEFTTPTGEYVFLALSVDDYEKLALNMNDITRYIEQLLALLSYYENLTEEESSDDNSTSR